MFKVKFSRSPGGSSGASSVPRMTKKRRKKKKKKTAKSERREGETEESAQAADPAEEVGDDSQQGALEELPSDEEARNGDAQVGNQGTGAVVDGTAAATQRDRSRDTTTRLPSRLPSFHVASFIVSSFRLWVLSSCFPGAVKLLLQACPAINIGILKLIRLGGKFTHLLRETGFKHERHGIGQLDRDKIGI